MRILIAPDKFKGTLSAKEAAWAIERGVWKAASIHGVQVEIDLCPVADGGEGTLEVVYEAVGGDFFTKRVRNGASEFDARWLITGDTTMLRFNPGARIATRGAEDLGPISSIARGTGVGMVITFLLMPLCFLALVAGAFKSSDILLMIGFFGFLICFVTFFGLGVLYEGIKKFAWLRGKLDDGRPRVAYMEAAEVVGLARQPVGTRNPEIVSTAPLGDLIATARELGCRVVVVALGGTASVDGGIGAASKLGWAFRGTQSQSLSPTGANLGAIRHLKGVHHEVGRPRQLTALCDVSNPLLGPNGAARVYGPQKGASPEQVERLEAGLTNLVRVCRECGIPCDPDQPGAGSAGGLGFGLATFLGAKLVPGAPFIFDLLKFDERVAQADLVITGEGRLDNQTASGKAAAEVARRAAGAGKPCFAVVGSTEGGPGQVRAALAAKGIEYAGVASAVETAGSSEAALQEPKRWLEEAAFRLMRARFTDG